VNDEMQDADGLPSRAVLDEWTVAEMPKDMKERVMAQMHEQWNVATQPVGGAPFGAYMPAQSNGAHVLAMVVAAIAATAAAAALVITWQRGDVPAPVGPPQSQPTAVALPPELTRPNRGHLTLEVDPPDAVVEIDGRTIEGPSPFVATGLAIGPHDVLVKRDGHVEWKRVVDMPGGQLHLPITLVAADPTPMPLASGVGEIIVPPKSTSADPPSDTPEPRVRQAKAEVEGALDKDIIRRIVRAHINEVRYCFNRGLLRDKTLEGRVSIQFTVNGEGEVPVAVVADSSVKDTAVGECIAKAVKRWTFPKPDGGGTVVVTYPFVLETD
jgi:TonB family protein